MAVDGDSERTTRIATLKLPVNSTGQSTERHPVTDSASALIGQAFGDSGADTHRGFGAALVSTKAGVEIESIAETGQGGPAGLRRGAVGL